MGAYNVTFGQSSVDNVDYEAYLKGGGGALVQKAKYKNKTNKTKGLTSKQSCYMEG